MLSPTRYIFKISRLTPLGIPFNITTLSQLHQSPPFPFPEDLGRGSSHQSHVGRGPSHESYVNIEIRIIK